MKKSTFNENQVIKILKDQDSSPTVAEICRGEENTINKMKKCNFFRATDIYIVVTRQYR